jgi:hypothetical protein
MKKTIIAIAIATLSAGAYASGAENNSNSYSNAGVYVQQNAADGVHYSGSYELKNVPAVAAPALTTTLTETCMGSSSVGGAGVGFGFSIGTTWRDTACVRRLDARQVAALGYRDAARELMCDSPAVAAAFERAGMPNCGAGVAAAPAEKAVEPTPALGHPMFDAQ